MASSTTLRARSSARPAARPYSSACHSTHLRCRTADQDIDAMRRRQTACRSLSVGRPGSFTATGAL
eukprot:2362904-Prymnesium_polylepis.1